MRMQFKALLMTTLIAASFSSLAVQKDITVNANVDDELEMTQADVAARAGIGTNTVSNLEAGRNVGFENLVRVAMVLGRSKEFENLFLPKLETLDDILRYENSAKRQRIKRKSENA